MLHYHLPTIRRGQVSSRHFSSLWRPRSPPSLVTDTAPRTAREAYLLPPATAPLARVMGRAAFAVQVLSLSLEQVAVAGLQQLQENGSSVRHGRGYHAARAERLHGHERPRGENCLLRFGVGGDDRRERG